MKALITGASSGIGRDMARVLASKGYELVLVARDTEKLNALAKELTEKDNINVEVITMDLTSENNCKELYNKATKIDLLINNAGFGDCGYFDKTDLDKDIAMIKTNVMAYHILIKLYLKDMTKNNSGKILNVASIAGFMPGPLMASYYATKSYVVRLSEAIRQELKYQHSKVQISILCPGPVETNFNKVANVKFSLREANSANVARYAIKKLEAGKFYIIPGIDVKIAKYVGHILPDRLLGKICFRAQIRKLDNI